MDYMFIQNNIQMAVLEEVKATVLILPYIDQRFEMLIFNPTLKTSKKSIGMLCQPKRQTKTKKIKTI